MRAIWFENIKRLYCSDNLDDIFLGGLKWILIPFQSSLGFKIMFTLCLTVLFCRSDSVSLHKFLPSYRPQNSIPTHKQLHGQGIGRVCTECSESYAFLRETLRKECVRSFVIPSMFETEQTTPRLPSARESVCPQDATSWNGLGTYVPSTGHRAVLLDARLGKEPTACRHGSAFAWLFSILCNWERHRYQ